MWQLFSGQRFQLKLCKPSVRIPSVATVVLSVTFRTQPAISDRLCSKHVGAGVWCLVMFVTRRSVVMQLHRNVRVSFWKCWQPAVHWSSGRRTFDCKLASWLSAWVRTLAVKHGSLPFSKGSATCPWPQPDSSSALPLICKFDLWTYIK